MERRIGILAIPAQRITHVEPRNRPLRSLLLLPAGLALGSGSIIVYPSMYVALAVRFVDQLLRHAISDTAFLLWLPVPAVLGIAHERRDGGRPAARCRRFRDHMGRSSSSSPRRFETLNRARMSQPFPEVSVIRTRNS